MASFIFTFLAIVVALAAGGAGGYMYRKNVQEKKIGRNEEFARNLLDEAQKRAIVFIMKYIAQPSFEDCPSLFAAALRLLSR